MLKIVAMSDTHLQHRHVYPDKCDILIHAGDVVIETREDMVDFIDWFVQREATHRIYVPGNHDMFLDRDDRTGHDMLSNAGIHCLIDSGVHIEGLNFYGMPWTPKFGNWAFMLERGSLELQNLIKQIPSNTNVLITHGPATGILDRGARGESIGDAALRNRILQISPLYHIFGHAHVQYGIKPVEKTTHVNVSLCDSQNQLTRTPITLWV